MRHRTDTYSPKDMAKVPNLREELPAIRASEIWKGANLCSESILDLAQRVSGLVRGSDTVGSQQVISWVSLESAGEP